MDRPRVSALVKGKISKFSTDRLIRALLDLGQDVQLQIRLAKGGKGRHRWPLSRVAANLRETNVSKSR